VSTPSSTPSSPVDDLAKKMSRELEELKKKFDELIKKIDEELKKIKSSVGS